MPRGVAGEEVRAGDAEDTEARTEQDHEQDNPGRTADQQQRGDTGGLAAEQQRGSGGGGQAAGGGGEHDPPGDLDHSQRACGRRRDRTATASSALSAASGSIAGAGTKMVEASPATIQPRPGRDGAYPGQQHAERERSAQCGRAAPAMLIAMDHSTRGQDDGHGRRRGPRRNSRRGREYSHAPSVTGFQSGSRPGTWMAACYRD